jgi:formylglycine-generating enzyme required for sulfatase activity
MRDALRLILLGLVFLSMNGQPLADRKALVIGNGNYASLAPLPSVPSDAGAIADALQSVGFHVTKNVDLRRRDMLSAIHGFVAGLQEGDVAVFYFSGYGMQVDGENYIVPIDYDPNATGDIDYRAHSVVGFQQLVARKNPRLQLIFLDAGHDNRVLDPTGDGLARPQPAGGESVVLLSTTPGQTVKPASNSGRGVFAGAIADVITEPGVKLLDVVADVTTVVRRKTGGAQTPYLLSSVVRSVGFTFREPAPEIVRVRTNEVDKQEYVLIPKGEFVMGCVSADQSCGPDETPHKVTLTRSFWMSATETTVAAYRQYAQAANVRVPPLEMYDKKAQKLLKSNYTESEDSPVINTQWAEAKGYCEWAGGRLPTEAEWEYAARGGVADRIFPWGNQLTHNDANFLGTGGLDIWQFNAPSATFKRNEYGLYNMAGNVWEWCADWYAGGIDRVARGGSSQTQARELRNSNRGHFNPRYQAKDLGFRCVVDNVR